MKQLALGISPPPEPTLDNFIAGDNEEALARLRELAAGRLREAIVYLWGDAGSGRSHLLAASARFGAHTADDVESLDDAAQVDLFNRINAARETGGHVVAAGSLPPNQLPLREDLRTRLGWGLVYRLRPLSDEARAVYLAAESERRGMKIPLEVIHFLLSQARRDLPSLLAVLEHLDRSSLEQKRPLTLPLAREALRELER